MNFDQFSKYRDQALILHQSQQGDDGTRISLDAIFQAVMAHAVASGTRAPGRPPVERTPPPEWFKDALRDLSGRRVTVGEFLLLAGQTPATQDDARNVGRWLRDAGKQPRKVSGQQVFQL